MLSSLMQLAFEQSRMQPCGTDVPLANEMNCPMQLPRIRPLKLWQFLAKWTRQRYKNAPVFSSSFKSCNKNGNPTTTTRTLQTKIHAKSQSRTAKYTESAKSAEAVQAVLICGWNAKVRCYKCCNCWCFLIIRRF